MRRLQVRVKPGARVQTLTECADGTWLAQVEAPPVDGKANEALIALIAAHFDLRRSQVEIKTGAGSRQKRVQLAS